MKIDPMRSLGPIDDLIARTTNPRHQAMLQNFRTHIIAEVTGDLETIMSTLVPEPVYHTYSTGSPPGGPVGQQQTRAFYQNMFDHGYNVLEKEIDRIYVCDDYIFNDGWMYTVFPGRELAARGLPVDADGWYLYTNRTAAVLPYVGEGADVLMAGEDVYTLGAPVMDRLQPLTVDELPDLLREQLEV
jgi:hypothetical protein